MCAAALKEFKEHLFDGTTDGFIQIFNMDDFKIRIKNTTIDSLIEVIEERIGEKDTFITPNTMYKPKREVINIRQFRALYMDLDNIEGDQHYITYKVLELAESRVIPKPSMVVSSGRGIHLYWRIKNAPYGALSTWQELEDYLYYKLKKYGADRGATDGARVLRLPGTINSRNNAECRVLLVDNTIEYSMYDLREEYLNYSYKKKNKTITTTTKKNNNIIRMFNSYSLHIARAQDLLKLCELRNYNMRGCRNMVLHCFAYWQGIYIRNDEQLAKEVYGLNNCFTEPKHDNEVKAILKCVDKAIEKFISYEQGVRSGELKRVTKGMIDKAGYWYTNTKLIDKLRITTEEEMQLKTIIGTKEKYRRNNERRKDARRNEEGLTKKQKELKELKEKVLELKEEGLSNVKIAEKLGTNESKVRRILKL